MAALLFAALASSPVLLLEFESFGEVLWGGMVLWTLAVCDLVTVVLKE